MEYDSTTSEYSDKERDYDAVLGSTTTEDPLGFAAGDANLYRYVQNSSPNDVDPNGEQQGSSGGQQQTTTGQPGRQGTTSTRPNASASGSGSGASQSNGGRIPPHRTAVGEVRVGAGRLHRAVRQVRARVRSRLLQRYPVGGINRNSSLTVKDDRCRPTDCRAILSHWRL